MARTSVLLGVLATALLLGAFAPPASAATPPSRAGAYAGGMGGPTQFDINTAEAEASLLELFESPGVPFSDYRSSVEDSDIGYQMSFGYRFNRFVAFELSVIDFGELSYDASGT